MILSLQKECGSLKKPNLRKGSVVRIWTTSYIAIFIIPMLVCFIIYLTSSQMIQAQVRSVGHLSLQNVREQMDAEITRVMSDSFEVRQMRWAYTSTASGYHLSDWQWLNDAGSFKNATPYDLKLAVETLRNVELMKESLEAVFLYFPASDIIVSNINTQSAERYYDYYFSEYPHQKQEWLELVRSNYYHDGRILSIELHDGNRNRGTDLYYLTSTHPAGNERGFNLIMQFSRQNLSACMSRSTVYEDAQLAILADNGELIYSPYELELTDNMISSIGSAPQGLDEWQLGGIPYVAIHLPSQALPVKYLLLVSQESFYNQFAAMRYMILAIAVLAVIVGVAMIILFVRLNYNPLRRLMKTMKKDDRKRGDNEYNVIAEAFDTLSNEKGESDRRAYLQERALRGLLITRILHGAEQFGVATQELLETHHLNFEGHFFAVVTVSIDDASQEIFLSSKEMEMDELYRQRIANKGAQVVATNVLEELLGQHYICYSTNTDGMTSCLINLPDNNIATYRNNVNAAASRLAELARDRFDTSVSIAASEIVGSLSSVPTAYGQIAYALEYSQSFDDNHAVFYSDIPPVMVGSYYYPPSVEQQLMHLIEEGGANDARTLINSLFERNLNENVGIDMMRFLTLNIVGTFFKAIEFTAQEKKGKLGEVLKSAGDLYSVKGTEDLECKFNKIVTQYLALIEISSKPADAHQHEKLCTAIEDYVHQNYKDLTLSIPTIADMLGVNASYVSRLMRKNRGVGLLDYINSYRIEQAKNIIAVRENFTVEELAREAGFATAKTFTRCFKKYVGTTPGKFKSDITR